MTENRPNPCEKASTDSQDTVLGVYETGKETDALIAQDNDKSDIKAQFVGYGCVAIGMIGLSLGQMFAQLLNRLLPHSELNALRYAVQFVIAIIVLGVSEKKQVRVEKENIGWLILASVAAVTVSYTSYGAAYYLPIGMSCALSRSLEMFAYFFITLVMSGTVKVDQLAAVCLCAVGVLLVAQPPLIFNKAGYSLVNSLAAPHPPCNSLPENFSVDKNGSGNSSASSISNMAANPDHILGYSLVALEVPACVIGLLVVRYKLKDLDTMIYVFWNAVTGISISLVLMLATEVPRLPHLWPCVMFLIGHMLVSGSHNAFLTFGYKYSNPVMSGLIKTIQIPSNFILQYTVLSGMYPGHANVVEIVGAVVVFTGNALVPFVEALKYRREQMSRE